MAELMLAGREVSAPDARRGLRGRPLVVILLVLSVAFVGVWFIATMSAREGMLAISNSNLELGAQSQAGAIAQAMNDAFSDAVSSARLDLAAEAIDSGDPKNLQWYADEIVRTKKKYAAIMVINKTGAIVAASTIGRNGEKLPVSLVGRSVANEPWIDAVYKSKRNVGAAVPASRPRFLADVLRADEQVVGFGLPILDIVDETIGALLVLVSLDFVGEMLSRSLLLSETGVSSIAVLVEQHGRPVALPRSLSARDAWGAVAIPQASDGSRWVGPDAMPFLRAESPVGGAALPWGWRLVALVAESEIEAPVRQISLRLLGAFSTCMVVVVVLMLFLTARMLGPLRASAGALAQSSAALNSISREMVANAGQAAAQASAVSTAAGDVSANSQSVAAASGELTATIQEIANNALEASSVADAALVVAKKADGTIQKLSATSGQIAQVVKLINSVAEETGMLALNAAIEASRAGVAGKGFAVVAHEVKELARETAQATEDIRRQIGVAQHDAKEAVTAMQEVMSVIKRIGAIQQGISTAVEQQTLATGQISRSAVETARASAAIAGNATAVASATGQTTTEATLVQKAANELTAMASAFKQIIGQYRF